MTPQQQIEALLNEGKSYYRIGKDTGISNRTISNWHKGSTKPESDLMIEVLNKYYKKIINSKRNKL